METMLETSLNRDEMEKRRLEAVQDLQEGLTQSSVARKFGVSRTTASRWNRALRQKGVDALRKRRAGYEKELAFYQDSKDKKAKSGPPTKLTNDIKNSDIDLKAQEDLLAVKKKEVSVINAKYDEDKKRYLEATRGKR